MTSSYTLMMLLSMWHMSRKSFSDCTRISYMPRPQANKCEFHTMPCKYLGYMLSPSSLGMAQNKIQAIQDWLEPQKVRDVQSFLGFVNFYCRFIYGYSMITVPLTCLTKKNVPWDWSNEFWIAFNT